MAEERSPLALLDSDERSALVALGQPRAVDAGDVLMREGDEPHDVVMVVAGRVKAHVTTSRGPTAVLGFRGPGSVLGDLGALTGEPRTATVVAIEPGEVIVIAASDFRRHLAENPALALRLLAQMGGWLRDADRRRAEHLTSDTTARVAARLLELGEQYGIATDEGERIAMPLTQEELAGLAGSSLEAVAKALRTLRSAGWIQTGRREITLRDADALRERAQS